MRIRKRKVPLPLSLLSPIPLSDPHLFSRSPVLVSHGGAAPPPPITTDNTSVVTSINSGRSQPSDQLTFTFPDTSASDLRRLIVVGNTRDKVVGEEDGMIQTSNDDASNATITTSTMAGAPSSVDDNNNNNNGSSLQSLSNDNSGLWCDGEKAIPLKKRRGSFNNICVDDYIPKYNNTTPGAATTTAMITKADDNNNNDNDNGNVNQVASVAASAKKGNNKRGNTIMEGSRCSRVNGRGWRCCQPTLVGYSLCEHHLGKGRLRSVSSSSGGSSSNSVKGSRSTTAKYNKSNANISLPLGRDERQRVANDDDKKTLGNKNKRVKLGLVKARSLSSLLGQTNTIAGDNLTIMEHQDHHQ